jgi:hypothetical protein
MNKIILILISLVILNSCNVAEITGIAETNLGNNFSGRRLDVDEGIINFWRLDGASGSTRIDSYNTADLSESGTVLGTSSSIGGGAAECNGGTLENPSYSFTFDPALYDYTFSFWAKFNGGTTADVNTVIEFNSSTYIAFTQLAGPVFDMQFNFSGTSVFFNTAVSSTELGQWIHFTAVLESSSDVTLYKNGTLFGTQANTFSGGGDTGVYICTDSTSSQPFNGSLDNIGVWERSLGSDEISALAKGETNVD